MNRRNFLQALGLGGSATALQACGLDDNLYYTPIEQILPYVVRPEHTTPGTPTYYATCIGSGPTAWPVVAHHRDGRMINLSANRRAPVPPLVPGAQLLEVQRHWSPDRVLEPRQMGQVVEWTAALAAFAAAVQTARAAGKKVAWLGPYRSGSIVPLLRSFTQEAALFWEPLGRDSEALAAKALFGEGAGLPRYDLTEARYVLSFGAPFLSDAWGSPGMRTAFANAKNANQGHFVARFAAVTPVKDQTAANADQWYPCVPGSEAKVALAVARLVAEETGHTGPAATLVASGDVESAATVSEIPADTIRAIAKVFAAGAAVALPGGLAGASGAATELAAAVYLLNVIAAGRGLFTGGGYQGPISTAGDVDALVADMEAGRVGVLLVDDVDPVHHLADGARFAAAMGKVDLVVSVSSFPSETAALCTLVLPTADATEDWGDEEPWAGMRVVRQPAGQPRGDVRSLGDILLATSRALDPAAPVATWRETVRAGWSDDALVAGFIEGEAQRGPLEVTGSLPTGEGAGEGAGELYLQVFAHAFVLDGRYANEPWAQESPDPMTGQVWDSWALVHPTTAERLGVGDNDVLTLQAGGEAVDVSVEVHPLVHPHVIAVPLGGGHSAAKGRYAHGTGVNIVRALAARRDGSGALAIQGARCTVTAAGRKGSLVSTFGNDDDRDRNFVSVVDAEAWAAQGDVEREHPGDLTGIRHLPMDRRLREAEAEWHRQNPGAQPEHTEYVDFYPVPDHPTYRFALTVDTNSCNGCGACGIACYAENNLGIVGKESVEKSRQMSWIRVNRYFADHTDDGSKSVHFVPMMCQQCAHAPCESVCPVLATYHTIDGLNAMIYNRCVGTRYCANACPYSVRRFNYHTYAWPEPFNLQLNPDVVARTMGVMEKCTFCVQRIRRTKSAYRDQGFTNTIPDEALRQLPACADACPSQALTFGNLLDPASVPATTRKSGRSYFPIAETNTFPAVNYLSHASFSVHRASHDESGDHPGPDAAGAH